MKMCKIEGETYYVRDHLKALGAKWNPEEKAWYIQEDKLDEAKAFVAAAPAKQPPKEPKKRKTIHARCPTCGTEFEV